jgi:hypothetical protein
LKSWLRLHAAAANSSQKNYDCGELVNFRKGAKASAAWLIKIGSASLPEQIRCSGMVLVKPSRSFPKAKCNDEI